MKAPTMGEFEEIVLLAVCGLKNEAYAIMIQERIEEKTHRSATMGAIYSALERLEEKGYAVSRLGEITRQRGGRRKRFYRVTPAGMAALHKVRETRERLWQDIEPLPELSPS